jgi:prevent-host-death family protein
MNKHTGVWSFQEAKAKFSEVVRRAQTEGPQLVTVHGKEAVMISAVESEASLKRRLAGKDLVAALRAGPKFEIELSKRPKDMKFRDVEI